MVCHLVHNFDPDMEFCGELQTMEVKTNRQLRIHELIVEHSSETALIVMSLLMPRKDVGCCLRVS
uniref:SLC12A transporter C-terminal domain-containing protein n=1 Tax=Glossina morsitans morsitans TaxID=37546 RepID=A0ABK9NGF5_GLOMM